jgi:hypothetical protein
MNKKLLILIAGLVVTISVTAGCTLRDMSGNDSKIAPEIPHAVDVRFNNCLVCHAADLLRTEGKMYDHIEEQYTNEDCSSRSVCHARAEV